MRKIVIVFICALTLYAFGPSPLLADEQGWKTYRNDKDHFEISYPGDGEETSSCDPLQYGVDLNLCLSFSNPNGGRSGVWINVNDLDDKSLDKDERIGGQCGEVYVTGIDEMGINTSVESITINSIPFKLVKTEDVGLGEIDKYYVYFTVHNGRCYRIGSSTHFHRGPDDSAEHPDWPFLKDYDPAFVLERLRRIVSTFKFTD